MLWATSLLKTEVLYCKLKPTGKRHTYAIQYIPVLFSSSVPRPTASVALQIALASSSSTSQSLTGFPAGNHDNNMRSIIKPST